jgi:hypothetical protein
MSMAGRRVRILLVNTNKNPLHKSLLLRMGPSGAQLFVRVGVLRSIALSMLQQGSRATNPGSPRPSELEATVA